MLLLGAQFTEIQLPKNTKCRIKVNGNWMNFRTLEEYQNRSASRCVSIHHRTKRRLCSNQQTTGKIGKTGKTGKTDGPEIHV